MKIVVIGGSGLIGSKLVGQLRQKGHEVVAASPNIGRQHHHAARGWPRRLPARRSSSTWRTRRRSRTKAVLEFFETSGRNLLAAEAAAGVRHHVALSVVGTDRLPDSGYLRAKLAQEKLIKASGDSLHDPALDAVLRIRQRASSSRAPTATIRLSPALSAADRVGRCRRRAGRSGGRHRR